MGVAHVPLPVRSGVSLHVGVDRVDAHHYGPLRALRGAERDARSMAQLAEAQAFDRRVVLVGEEATIEAVRRELARAAGRLRPGDTFLFTFAGYGGAVPELTCGTNAVGGGSVRSMCLYDQQLLVPLLEADLARFRSGVRIVLVNDSCRCTLDDGEAVHGADVRALPPATAAAIYRRHLLAYDAWQAEARAAIRGTPPSPAVALEAGRDGDTAREDAYHGRFTSALLTVWNGGRYLQQPEPTYRDLLARAGEILADPNQVPQLSLPLTDNPRRLADQRPFVLEG
jgi:hypothetical protein